MIMTITTMMMMLYCASWHLAYHHDDYKNNGDDGDYDGSYITIIMKMMIMLWGTSWHLAWLITPPLKW